MAASLRGSVMRPRAPSRCGSRGPRSPCAPPGRWRSRAGRRSRGGTAVYVEGEQWLGLRGDGVFIASPAEA